MCGIVGVALSEGRVDETRLVRMRDTMVHRGPDDAGVFVAPDGRVGLAHRRLSIIDLSAASRQPLTDPQQRLSLVFNGEIYNFKELREELRSRGHSFRTTGDSEVVLEAYRAWGDRCVERLNGMFAFALYDQRERRVFAARDRAGEKPFFYSHRAGGFRFASELKALMADPTQPRTLDRQALASYLAFGYVAREQCILEGVNKLPQGHALTYDLESDFLRVWPYWELPDPARPPFATREDLVDELDGLLEDAVKHQLVADVPVGILLSGGIDSSLVTALAARVSSSSVKTFTISFPGHGKYNEAEYARVVADHFGTDHTELPAEAGSVELLPELARQFDEPMADSSMVPTFLVSQLIRQHATVALGGDGGDELFGGYHRHSDLQREHLIRRSLPKPVRSVASRMLDLLPPHLRGRKRVQRILADLPDAVARTALFFDGPHREALLTDDMLHLGGPPPEDHRRGLGSRYQSPLAMATAVDFMTYMVDDILVKVDRASMLTSLEVRAPLLDYRIIEFAFGRVPDDLRATRDERKVLLKDLARRVLPSTLDLQRKQGFSLPLDAWVKGQWGDFVAEVLSHADPGIFRQEAVDQLMSAFRRGLTTVDLVYAIVMFTLWQREYDVSAG